MCANILWKNNHCNFSLSTIFDFNSLSVEQLQEWLIFTKKDLTVADYINNKSGLFSEFNLLKNELKFNPMEKKISFRWASIA